MITSLWLLLWLLGSAKAGGVDASKVNYVQKFLSPHEYDITIVLSPEAKMDTSLKDIQENHTPVTLLTLPHLQSAIRGVPEQTKCPIFFSYGNVTKEDFSENIFVRKSPLPEKQKPRALVFWNIDGNMSKQTVLASYIECPQLIDLGLLRKTWQLHFFVASEAEGMDVLKDELIQSHPKILTVMPTGTSSRYVVMKPDYTQGADAAPEEHLLSCGSDDCSGWLTSDFLRLPTNLKGRELRAGTIVVQHGPGEEIDRSKLIELELLQLEVLESAYNFYTHVTTPDKLFYQKFNETGHWEGLLAMVAYGNSEFVFNGVPQSLHDTKVSMTMCVSGLPLLYLSFATPHPSLNPKYVALVMPFEALIWVCLGIALVSMTLVLKLFISVAMEEKDGLATYFWLCFAMFIGENVSKRIFQIAQGLRFLLLLWLFFSFLMTAGYAGNLKSWLTNPGRQPPLESLQDVLDSDLELHWMFVGVEDAPLVREANDPLLTTVYENRKEKSVFEMPLVDIMLPVLKQEAVVFGHSTVLDEVIDRAFTTGSGVKLIRRPPVFVPLHSPYQVNYKLSVRSPFFDLFNHANMRLLECGVFNQLEVLMARGRREVFLETNKLPTMVDDTVIRALNLDDTQAIFYLLVLLTLFALISLAMEGAWWRFKKSRKL